MDIIYDAEVFPNVFTLAAEHADYPLTWAFEISADRDDSQAILDWMLWIKQSGGRMVGFNNVGFDYPILHMLVQMGRCLPQTLYAKCQAIIESENRFENVVYPSDRFVPQVDLYRIHHFDNKARATSLKALEFNMRMDNISDLPFPVGTVLNREQIAVLKDYNAHDVKATKLFYHQSLDMIRFREELTKKHGKDFLNDSDVKIGKTIFQLELEKAGVQCYEYGSNGRQPKQTKRPVIHLKDCIPACVDLHHPEFVRIKDWLAAQSITETKGVFKDVIARVGGLEFVFGTGGLHASVENEAFVADDEMMILDVDVTSLYPSIAIGQGYYPEHLGPRFVEVYRQLREQRVSYKKGTAENAMLKLALNGVYGASGDQFSIFFDPLFTMRITIGGQLMIAMLAERLLEVPGLRIIQTNTDGITMYVRRDCMQVIKDVCSKWEKVCTLSLEFVEYQTMCIRDVNNYLCVKTDGSTKRKGAYEHDIEWHQDGSALVVPKVVEMVLRDGVPIRETLENWPDKMDFMIRLRVNRGSRVEYLRDGQRRVIQNTVRYYVAHTDGRLWKIMPPLKGKDTEREFSLVKGWNVQVCNDVADAYADINFDWYVQEAEKLVLGVM